VPPAVHLPAPSYGREELSRAYLAADVLLVTHAGRGEPGRQGSTSHPARRARALVLSEFAGAAIELPQSFLVNRTTSKG